MRHVVMPGPVVRLPGGVPEPPRPRRLVAPAGSLEGRAPRVLGAQPGAVPIPSIAGAAEKEHPLTVEAGAAHAPERVHGPWRATRKGVDTREEVCELWSCDWLNRVPAVWPEGPEGSCPPDPHPLGALVGPRLPYLGRPRQSASFRPCRRLFRPPPFPVVNDIAWPTRATSFGRATRTRSCFPTMSAFARTSERTAAEAMISS